MGGASRWLARAHPRVGGENVVAETKNFSRAGSSPRGRGKLNANFAELKEAGLIPAWAGKTGRYKPPLDEHWAHPRVGGENLVTAAARLEP